jgi:hypothetical protein
MGRGAICRSRQDKQIVFFTARASYGSGSGSGVGSSLLVPPYRSKLTLTSARRTANSSLVPNAAHALAAHYFSRHRRNPLEPLPRATTPCPPTQCYILFRFEHRQTANLRIDSECSTANAAHERCLSCANARRCPLEILKDLTIGVLILLAPTHTILSYCLSLLYPSTLAKSLQQSPLPEHPRPRPASAAHHLSHPTR